MIKNKVRKNVADKNITLNEIAVQRRIMLKHQKQMIKWEVRITC